MEGFDGAFDDELENEMLMEQEQQGDFEDEYDVLSDAVMQPTIKQSVEQSVEQLVEQSQLAGIKKRMSASPPRKLLNSSFQLSNDYSSGMKPKMLTPKDMAVTLQKERIMLLNSTNNVDIYSKSVTLDTETNLVTSSSLLSKDKHSALFLHNRPCTEVGLESLSCVLADGSRCYIRRRKPKRDEATSLTYTNGNDQLLSKSMAELRSEAERIQVSGALQNTSSSAVKSQPHSEVLEKEKRVDVRLWVDKYSPNTFSQLLSPEKINREVLRALKRWDKFVFKGEVTSVATGNNGQAPDNGLGDDFRPRNKVIMLCGPPGTGKTTLAHVMANHCGYRVLEINSSDDRSPDFLREVISRATQSCTLDVDKRPNCVVLDEIDGIDGSSGKGALDALISIIKAPLQGPKSAKGAKTGSRNGNTFALTRPLICICNDPYVPALRELKGLADVFVFAPPSEQRLTQRLKTVCAAEGLQMSNSSFLADLCNATGSDIRSAINHLQFATLKSSKDQQTGSMDDAPFPVGGGRSATPKVDIGVVLESMLQHGLKDDHLDAYQVWREVFVLAPPSSAVSLDKNSKTHGQSCMSAMDAMAGYGDFPVVIAGLFENMHQIGAGGAFGPVDSSLVKQYSTSEWMSFVDELGAFTTAHPDGFQVLGYVPCIAAAVKLHTASRRKVKVEWPKKDREMFYLKQQRCNILNSVLGAAQSSHNGSSATSKQVVVMDLLSNLVDILSPRVRALPMITLSPGEQQIVTDVCRVMESYGLTYQMMQQIKAFSSGKPRFQRFGAAQQGRGFQNNNRGGFKNDRSQYDSEASVSVLQLEPALHELLSYELGDCELLGRHRAPSAEMKHLIATEQRKVALQVQLERLRTHEKTEKQSALESKNTLFGSSVRQREREMPSKEQLLGHQNQAAVPSPNVASASDSSTSHKIMQAQMEQASSSGKRQRSGAMNSFFPSVAGKKSEKVQSTSAAQLVLSDSVDTSGGGVKRQKTPAIHFKFNQGFSNAVRRTVNIREFL